VPKKMGKNENEIKLITIIPKLSTALSEEKKK
jgi:hypothetical protein